MKSELSERATECMNQDKAGIWRTETQQQPVLPLNSCETQADQITVKLGKICATSSIVTQEIWHSIEVAGLMALFFDLCLINHIHKDLKGMFPELSHAGWERQGNIGWKKSRMQNYFKSMKRIDTNLEEDLF